MFAKLYRKTSKDGLEDGFNTPTWIYKTIGVGIYYDWQSNYLWQSSLATGTVTSYHTLDVSVQCDVMNQKLNIKVSGSNILNTYYYSFIGGQAIGAFFYMNVTLKL